jgi:hypothetical protein
MFRSISSQRRVVPNAIAAPFVEVIWLEQNAHASLRNGRMRRLESDIITQNPST